MFDKKIILLISFLLVTGSSYIIFHRKKNNNNNDEVNIIDNSDVSINEEESSSSFLKYSFFFFIVIIVAIIMFFAVKKIVKKKKKTLNEEKPTETEEENDIKNKNPNNENNEDKFFEEYNEFKEDQANKQKIADGIKNEVIKEIVLFLEDNAMSEYNKIISSGAKNKDDYHETKYIIDLSNNLVDSSKVKDYEKDNKKIFRFNVKEHKVFLSKIIFKFFAVIAEGKEGMYKDVYDNYTDNIFKNNNEAYKKNTMYFFIATIIEPFFEAISKNTYNKNTFYFLRFSKPQFFLKGFFASLFGSLSEEEKKIINEICQFFIDVTKSECFALIFNRLIGVYIPKI